MDTGFVESASGVSSIAWALAAVIIAALFFHYLRATAQLRFQAKEAKAVRDQAREAQEREDRLKREERSATIAAERERLKREEDARNAEAKRARLANLHAEAKADAAGNAACAVECIRILANADAILVTITRYFTVCDGLIDSEAEEPAEPFVQLGDMLDELRDSHGYALDYFSDAQKMIDEGLYIVAKQNAENCLVESRYCADRIINLDTTQWNEIQAEVR